MGGTGMFAAAGFTAIKETFEEEILFGTDMAKSGTLWIPAYILGTTRDAGNTPTTILRPGLVMAKLDTGAWTHYDPDGVGGQQIARAVLAEEIRAQDFDANNTDRHYRLATRAPLKASKLLGLDRQARAQLARVGCVFDDFMPNLELPHLFQSVKTDNYTITAAESGGLFIMNASSAKTFTLPALAPGLVYEFYNIGAAGMVIAAASGDTLIVGNDVAADSFTFSTAGEIIGASVRVMALADASKWLVQNLTCPATTKTGSTITVTT